MAALRERTYRRIVDPETSTSGISRRIRIQIRCAVCRCFLGALRSDSRIASINGIAGASFGRSRSGTFRSAGIALASARRTSRRCTPNFRDTARILPEPCSYSLRICSYSSTLALLFSNPSILPGANARNKIYGLGVTGGANSDARKGPIQSSELTSGDVRPDTRIPPTEWVTNAKQFIANGQPEELVQGPFLSAATFLDILNRPPEIKDFFGALSTKI